MFAFIEVVLFGLGYPLKYLNFMPIFVVRFLDDEIGDRR